MKIEGVRVVMFVDVSDDAKEDQIAQLDAMIEERENNSDEPEDELLYEAAKEHLKRVERGMKKVIVASDYDITRTVSVMRKSDRKS